MIEIIVFWTLTLAAAGATGWCISERENAWRFFIIVTLALASVTTVRTFNYGTVTLPVGASSLDKYLDGDQVYELVSAADLPAREGMNGWPGFSEELLVIKGFEDTYFFTLRVEKGTELPKCFTMFKSKPIAVPCS